MIYEYHAQGRVKGGGKGVICPRAPQLGKIKGRLELEKF